MTQKTLTGVVLDPSGAPVPQVDVKGCIGELTQTDAAGAFSMSILDGQHCSAFAFRESEDGFAKGSQVEIVGGETQRVELPSPGAAVSEKKQRAQLGQLAEYLLNRLDQEYSTPSPVTQALEQDPDNPILQAWSDEEVEVLNLMYDDAEYLLSPDATAEDWRDAWLFGIGM